MASHLRRQAVWIRGLGCLVGLWVLAGCGKGPAPAPQSAPADAPDQVQAPTRDLAPIPRVQTADAWLDLLAQRPNAVVLERGRVVVDLSREYARPHLELGHGSPWKLGEEVADRRAGVIMGRGGSLTIPLDGANAPALNPDTEEHAGLALAITLTPMVEKQMVTVLWNEKPLANLWLREGFERRTLSLPAEVVRPGENRLRVHFRRSGPTPFGVASAAVERVEVGSHEAITEAEPGESEALYAVQNRGPNETSIRLRGGTSLAYYFRPPRRGRLRLGVRGRGSFEVVISTDAEHRAGNNPRQLFREPLPETGLNPDIDLSGWAGVPVRLEFRARGTSEDAEATLSLASVMARRSVAVDRRRRAPRDVYILAIEGARGDSVFAPGRRPRLRNFERFASDAMVFERAYAVGAAAVPSHAAWLSSVAPPVHLTVRGTFVADAQVLLPEILKRAGFSTALCTANGYVGADRGLTQGFDDVEFLPRGTDDVDALAVLGRGWELASKRPGPRFLYSVVNDPQAPYDPPREVLGELERPEEAPLPHLTHIWVGRVRMGKREPERKELGYVRRLYRGELQRVDEALGQLLDRLEDAGRLDESMIVVMGVHGEEFIEHGGAGHGHTLYEESIRVPLAIRAPSLLAPGKVSVPVDLVDLAPTLGDLLGLPFPDGWQGESLVPLIDDPYPPPRLVEAYLGDGSRAAIMGDSKLVLGPGRGPRAERLYDLEADPRETKNVIEEGGVALRMLRAALAWQLAHEGTWRRGRWGTGANLKPAFALDRGM